MEKLSRCPLCGGNAKINSVKYQYYWGECEKCGVQSLTWQTRKTAVKYWELFANSGDHNLISGYSPHKKSD